MACKPVFVPCFQLRNGCCDVRNRISRAATVIVTLETAFPGSQQLFGQKIFIVFLPPLRGSVWWGAVTRGFRLSAPPPAMFRPRLRRSIQKIRPKLASVKRNEEGERSSYPYRNSRRCTYLHQIEAGVEVSQAIRSRCQTGHTDGHAAVF